MKTRMKLAIGALAVAALLPGLSIIDSTEAAARSPMHMALARYERLHGMVPIRERGGSSPSVPHPNCGYHSGRGC